MNQTVQFGVFGLVDHTHPAAAQFLDDAVMRNSLAKQTWKEPLPYPQAVILGTDQQQVNAA